MHRMTWLTNPADLAHDAPVVVLVTWPADRDAEPFVRTLVEERLVACANVLPAVRSIYLWKSVVQDDAEQQVVLKTTAGRVGALHARVLALHPYDVPEFIVLPVVAASEAYGHWLRESVAMSGS
jgi:periplasmic divalent cation tolerance protein